MVGRLNITEIWQLRRREKAKAEIADSFGVGNTSNIKPVGCTYGYSYSSPSDLVLRNIS